MKKTTILTLLLLSTTSSAENLKYITYKNAIVSEITSIYDGDTFRANIKNYPKIIGYRIPIRIKGIDTPELKGKCTKEKELARKAKEYTVEKLRSGKTIELRNIKRGKYFRLIADVYIDGNNLAKELISNNLAIKYHGNTKVNWCLYLKTTP